MCPFFRHGGLRTVVETELVAQRIDSALARNPKLSELYEMLQWRLARSPYSGHKIAGGNPERYIVKTYFWGPKSVPASITLVYQINDHEIIIEASNINWRERAKQPV